VIRLLKNVLHSAFSNAGQKCSATSILALQTEVYNDAKFLEGLVDAAKSLKVGEPWDLSNKIGPLVREPAGDLLWALTELESNEKWLLKPVKINNKTWTPGIKIGTKFGDKSHFEEFFGPVLTIMEFKDLDGAIRIVNST
jgi:RHH-type proline utilization regulon transcriptional repressor/proline dehydrogenase/delta 1-pyrroline-5-carboxylate dehydrogenase